MAHQKERELFLIRHGETEWSKNGNHTGLTDIPLTENGVKQAEAMARRLYGISFSKIYSSPLQRAKVTCEQTGLLPKAEITDALLEWNYGEYEGITSAEIHKKNPGWNVFTHGAPGGESVKQVTQRAQAFINELNTLEGKIALFSSGHFLRAFAAVYISQNIELGKHLLLSTASLSILSVDRGTPVISLWNDTSHFNSAS